MNYKEIITKVAKTIDPQETINVTIVNDKDMGDAHLVVADIEYSDSEMDIPFVIYDEESIFMPFDWACGVPETADDIQNIKWVTFPNKNEAIFMDGLPRTLTGIF